MEVKDIKLEDIVITENVRMGKSDRDMVKLMTSIRQDGLQEPIGVIPLEKGSKYHLIYGFRRVMAFKKLGFSVIPAVIAKDMETQDHLVINVIENTHRKDISPAELGRICFKLEKLHLNQAEIASRLGMGIAKIKACMEIFSRIPEYLHDKIAFFGKAGREIHPGEISSHMAKNVVDLGKATGLTKEELGDVLLVAHKHNLSGKDVELLAYMVKAGISVRAGIKELDKYVYARVDVLVSKKELEERKEEEGITQQGAILNAIYGRSASFKKPSFVQIKRRKN